MDVDDHRGVGMQEPFTGGQAPELSAALAARLDRYSAVYTRPPQRIPDRLVVDAPLLGNGDVGVAVAGSGDEQRFYLGKNDFWKQTHLGETVDQRTDRLLAPYKGFSYYLDSRPLSVGQVVLGIPELTGCDHHQEQNIFTAEVRGRFGNSVHAVSTRSWMQADANLLFTEVRNIGKNPLTIRVGHVMGVMDRDEAGVENGTEATSIWFTRSANLINHPDRRVAAVATRIVAERVDVQQLAAWDHGTNVLVTTLQPGETCVIVNAIVSDLDARQAGRMPKRFGMKGGELADFALGLIRHLGRADVDALAVTHARWWRSLWGQSSIAIGDPRLEQYYYTAHYILASAMRLGKVPPGLFGPWITTDWPKWTGSYTMNYNYQAPYWALYAANHLDQAHGYCQPLLDSIPIGKMFAHELLGCRGIYLPVELGPWGVVCANIFWSQKSNAAYAAANLLLHFFHSWDLAYARLVYPFLIECADFWEDTLVFADGHYHALNDAVDEQVSTEDTDNVLTMALLRQLFGGLIVISTALDVDRDRHDRWRHILAHLAPFSVAYEQDEAVLGLFASGRPKHGTPYWTQLQPVFPVGVIGLASDTKLLTLARNALRLAQPWADSNGFCVVYGAAARLGNDPEQMLAKLHEEYRRVGMSNLWTFHGGGGLEDCTGITAGLQEMLFQSHEGVLRLFPCWPLQRDAAFTTLRGMGAFLVSSEISSGVVRYVDIFSEQGRPCSVLNPWPGRPVRLTRAGGDHQQLTGETLDFGTSRGERVRLTAA